MLRLIVGLGNPGRQYQKTRHNAGFLFLDHLLSKSQEEWKHESRFQGYLAQYPLGLSKIIMLKPQTFMNKSGLSVGKLARYYKIQVDEILVVHDELDFEEGVVRIKKGGGHAGHNGLRDIIAHLGSQDFYRLRMGIGRPENSRNVADYVLSEPSFEGFKRLNNAFSLVESKMDKIIVCDMAAAMNGVHK